MTKAAGLGKSKSTANNPAADDLRKKYYDSQAKADRRAAAKERAASGDDKLSKLIRSVQKNSFTPEGEVLDELRRSEKEGKGSPERRTDSGHLVGQRGERKRKGEMGGRHHYSGSQQYGGSASERGKKKNEPGSQHQRLNPPEKKGRQLGRGSAAAMQRWHSARD